MELTGALSNPEAQVHLGRLVAVCREIARENEGREPPPLPKPRPPWRPVLQTVMAVLAQAEEPMRAIDVHRAVETLLGEPVPDSSVKSCLSRSASGPNAHFERVGHGRYRLAAHGRA